MITYIFISKIKQKYSRFWGAYDKTLKQGNGMDVSAITTTLNANGQTVLNDHHVTVFTDFGKLQMWIISV